MPFAPRLCDASHKVVLAPGMEWLARKERLDGHHATVGLAFFHREVDGAAALVTEDDRELGAHGFRGRFWEVVARPRGATVAAFGRLGRFAEVLDRFVGTVNAHVKLMFALCRRSDETILIPVVLDLSAAHELIKVKSGRNPAKGKTVRLATP